MIAWSFAPFLGTGSSALIRDLCYPFVWSQICKDRREDSNSDLDDTYIFHAAKSDESFMIYATTSKFDDTYYVIYIWGEDVSFLLERMSVNP